jgi:hypothetical protein
MIVNNACLHFHSDGRTFLKYSKSQKSEFIKKKFSMKLIV